MVTNHDVWDAVAQTDGTPGNSFEFGLDLFYGGSYKNTMDITNVNPAFTAKTRARQTYAAKGIDRMSKYGDNLVLTFDLEVVRDANGAYQPSLNAVIAASKLLGAANQMKIRAYDMLGADYAFESTFTISVSRSGTDWDSAAFFTVTATQSGVTNWIPNPVLVGNVPILDSALPSGAAQAAHVYIEGENFFKNGAVDVVGAASVKFGAVNATSYVVISDSLIDAVVPAGAAGSAPISVTNSAGTTIRPYIRA